MKLDIGKLARDRLTYANRNGNRYVLDTRRLKDSKVEVSYQITHGAAKRIVRLVFPDHVRVDEKFLWVLGLFKGEGLKSVGSRSSMYRFSVVNNDPSVIRAVIRVLDESGLESLESMRTRSGLIRISYGPYCDKKEAREYWALELSLPPSGIDLARDSEPQKREAHGSCALTLNDVLLRSIFDLIAENVYDVLFHPGSSS